MIRFSEICSGRYFVIPENQRGFSWGRSQLNDLIEDLKLADTQSHYLGPLIVTRSDRPDFQDDEFKTTAEFILEDGQQRLTTLFIFANEIRKEFVHRSILEVHAKELETFVLLKHHGTHLRLQNKQATLEDYFRHILTGAPAAPAERVPPMDALDEVKKSIAKFVENLSDGDLLAWKHKICNQALFVWVDLATAGVNRYLTFDAINSRGLPLSEFDKIKNFAILVRSVRSTISVDIASSWYRALVQLEQLGAASRAQEADFIAEIYSSYNKKAISHRDVHEDFVSKYRSLLTGSNAALEADFSHFIGLWEVYARSFGFISGSKRRSQYGSMCSADAGEWLDRLDNMNLPTITRPILAAAHLKCSFGDFKEVVKACEIYTFRVHAVIRRRKDANARKIIELANEILLGGKEVGYVLQKICALLRSDAPLERVVSELADGKPKYAYDPDVTGWAYCYYFLYEYEIANSPSGVAPLPYARNKELIKNQQEHILPQKHRDHGWWEAHWPESSKADTSKHRLGNLVLTANNPSLGRKPIADKLNAPPTEYSYAHPNATNTEKLIRTFTDGTTWTIENILKREVDMLQFACNRWGLGCSGDNGVISLPPEYAVTSSKEIVINVSPSVDEFDETASDVEGVDDDTDSDEKI